MAIYQLFDGADEPVFTPHTSLQHSFAAVAPAGAPSEEVDFLEALRLRSLLLLGGCLALLWTVLSFGLLLLSILFGTFLFAISLGTRRSGLALAQHLWRHVRLASAYSLGCSVSLFSLKFGLTILAIYFLLRSEEHRGRGLMGYVCEQINEAFGRFGTT